MKVASGNEKQALQQLNPNFMSDEEDGEDLAGTWIVRSPPWRSPRLSSMLQKLQEKIDGQPSSQPPKQQSSRNTMYLPSTNLFTSMGSVCWWQRENLWEGHLSTASNVTPTTLHPVISVSLRIWQWRWKWWKLGQYISRQSCWNSQAKKACSSITRLSHCF